MDFSWNSMQEDIRKGLEEFAKRELNDNICEKYEKAEFCLDDWKKCGDYGVHGLLCPASYGGMGLDILTAAYALEGFGYGCRNGGLIFSIIAHMCGCIVPIYRFGDGTQKDIYLAKLSKGEYIGAFAATEPEAGSDIFSLKTTAKKDKHCYILNGAKTFVSNAPVADLFLVLATTDTSKGLAGLCVFLVEKGTIGLSIGRNIDKSGLRTNLTSEIFFDECIVPEENLLGSEGMGMSIFYTVMDIERICMMAPILGSMARQIEICDRYIKERRQFGQPIKDFQSISGMIAEMKLKLEASRLLLYKAAWLLKQGKTAVKDIAMAKLYVSQSYVYSCLNAIQIHGGYGYTVEMELERELRDAIASTIYSGTSEIQKNIIAGI